MYIFLDVNKKLKKIETFHWSTKKWRKAKRKKKKKFSCRKKKRKILAGLPVVTNLLSSPPPQIESCKPHSRNASLYFYILFPISWFVFPIFSFLGSYSKILRRRRKDVSSHFRGKLESPFCPFISDGQFTSGRNLDIPSFAFLRRSILDISEKEFDHKLTFRNHLIMYLFNEGIWNTIRTKIHSR